MSYDTNLFAVDTTGVEKMGGFEIYPAGLYPAMMISATKKPNSKNNGAFIECVYQFTEGNMSGKKYTSRMNLWNETPQAVDIAKKELKSLRIALGLNDHTSDPAEFVHKPLVLDIGVKARKDDANKMENNLVNILPFGNAVASSAPQYAPQAQYVPQMPVAPPNAGWAPQPTSAPQPTYMAPGTAMPQQPQMPPAAFTPAPGAPPPWAAR